MIKHDFDGKALRRSAAHYSHPKGTALFERTAGFLEWVKIRRSSQVWPYSRALTGLPGPTVQLLDDQSHLEAGINLSSQDYLGLTADSRVHEAVRRALRDFGPHSAGSAVLSGNTTISLNLEAALGDLLQCQHVVLFPTGWAAGFGAITGLIREADHVLLDRLSHACLQQGAKAATPNVHRYNHLDLVDARRHLQQIRERDPHNAILVVTEGLFSMDADSPDLQGFQALCHEYDAFLMVDIAHDLGSMGPQGAGQLGEQGMLGKVDLVMGSFSKTFCSNGGFVAVQNAAVKEYLKYYGGPHTFSNALAPVQAAAVLEALAIVTSAEGAVLRSKLLAISTALRESLAQEGLPCLGAPSPIVPVPLGSEALSRITSHLVTGKGLLANLVEYPAVALGAARLRLQIMATHTEAQMHGAARIIGESWALAKLFAPTHRTDAERPRLNMSARTSVV